MLPLWKNSYVKPRHSFLKLWKTQQWQSFKKQRHHFVTKVCIVKAMVFPIVRNGCENWTIKKTERQKLTFSNCGAREDSWESLGPVNPKSTLNIHWKGWCWSWSSNTWATWYEKLAHWKRLWCWEKLRAREGGYRGLDGWMPSLIHGHEFEETQGDSYGQRSAACSSSWGRKEWTRLSDRTTTLTCLPFPVPWSQL